MVTSRVLLDGVHVVKRCHTVWLEWWWSDGNGNGNGNGNGKSETDRRDTKGEGQGDGEGGGGRGVQETTMPHTVLTSYSGTGEALGRPR